MTEKTKNLIKAEDLYKIQLVSSPRIAPDGQHIVFSVQRLDAKTEKKFSNLWVTSTTKENAARQFTIGDQSDTMPRWSPNGSQIAFLSNRSNKEKPSQIHMIPFDGGEARPVTDIQGEIDALSWRPDGKHLLCTVRKTDPEVIEREKDEEKKKLGIVDRHYNRVFYKLDGYGYLPHERTHIWTVDPVSGKASQLTDHAVYDELYPSYSPDGKWITFLSNRSAQPDFTTEEIDLFVMPAKGGEMVRIPTPPGEKSMPVFSPDGKWIAYFGIESHDAEYYKNTSLWIVPSDGSAAPRNLTQKYDIETSSWVINDLGMPEGMPPTWSLDGKCIYFQIAQHGSAFLMKIGIDGENLQTILGGAGAVGSFTLDRSQQRLSYFFGKMDDPGQVYTAELSQPAPHCLTNFNRALLDKIELGEMEEIWYQGETGNELQGWILKPPNFDPQKKYPSILEIHGGPLTQYGNFFMHEFYFLAAKGYVVHFTNPRGGRGYGEDHAKAIWRCWGEADYADLMTWTDLVGSKPYIDPQKMGVTGGSYGGYMTVWIIGHTQRFKAAVTQRCVSNFVSMWGTSDFNWTFEQEISNKPPFDDLLTFWDRSPIKYIGNAVTPTLVIHSEMDLRCPIEQGEQVFVALKRIGVDSEMVRFPDEFHGLSRGGRTDRRIARLNHIARWFNRYLKD